MVESLLETEDFLVFLLNLLVCMLDQILVDFVSPVDRVAGLAHLNPNLHDLLLQSGDIPLGKGLISFGVRLLILLLF